METACVMLSGAAVADVFGAVVWGIGLPEGGIFLFGEGVCKLRACPHSGFSSWLEWPGCAIRMNKRFDFAPGHAKRVVPTDNIEQRTFVIVYVTT